MKSLLAVVVFLVLLTSSRLSADEPTQWLSPDHKLKASVVLCHESDRHDLTWDIVTVENASGSRLASLSLEEGSGIDRAVVGDAVWSPDSRFFVFETESSGAHSIWHWPTYVYDATTSKIYSIDDTLGAVTCNNNLLKFSGPDSLEIWFWDSTKADGSYSPKIIDLRDFVKKGPKMALHAKCFVYAPHYR